MTVPLRHDGTDTVGLLIMVTVAPLVTVRAELTVSVFAVESIAVTVALVEPTVTVEPTRAPVTELTLTVVEELAPAAVVTVLV